MKTIEHQATEFIQSKLKSSTFVPRIGLILGSGLGSLVSEMTIELAIRYEDIPGFHRSSVQGHEGMLVLGHLYGTPVICMKGRYHLYEGIPPQALCTPIRTMKLLGCHTLVITNAAGSLRTDVGPGSISLIEDHINFSGLNPLVGINDSTIGPRFMPMDDAYDPALLRLIQQSARTLGITLPKGIYIGVLGPNYETPAEIRAFRTLGADLVGMSTVNEVIAARHCGLKVIGLSAISNFSAGISSTPVNHEEVLEYGMIASAKLRTLLAHALPLIEQAHSHANRISMDKLRQLYQCLDLTSLSGDETPASLKNLTDKGTHPTLGHVAAFCVYPNMLTHLPAAATTSIAHATVVNFPSGNDSLETIIAQIKTLIDQKTDEIDLVIPYQAVKQGRWEALESLMNAVSPLVQHTRLKLILESSEFSSSELETLCQKLLSGPWKIDFLKTSTGKALTGGATYEAARVILEAIAYHHSKTGRWVGFKVSGGVAQLEHALKFAELALHYCGPDYVQPRYFRIGASRLADILLANA